VSVDTSRVISAAPRHLLDTTVAAPVAHAKATARRPCLIPRSVAEAHRSAPSRARPKIPYTASVLQLELTPGTVFADEFLVVAPLSRGGMGAVYIVEQVSTKKRRALKLMLAARANDPEMRKRFEQEARVGAMIPSEHVVDVIAAGIDEATQIPWLAMELLDGEDLDAHAERRGALPPADVHEIFAQMCHALAAAHAIPIVHRDLKPANVYLARPRLAEAKPVVKVLDFGIAKIVGGNVPSTTAALGTPLWMSPEQSQPGSAILPAADVWALGLIAFRLLTGKLFWISANADDASPLAVVREVLLEPIASATDRARALGATANVPTGFDVWLAKCLAREPLERFADAGAAWRALSPILRSDRTGITSSGSISDVQGSVSSSATATDLAGLASTLLATPSVTPPPPLSDVSATLDAVGKTLGEPLPTQARSSRGRSVVLAGAVVLTLAAGLFFASRTFFRAPQSSASGTAASSVSSSAAAAPPAALPAPFDSTPAPGAPLAPASTATPSSTRVAPMPTLHGRPTIAKPQDAPAPSKAPTPKPAASTPFLL
jgi:serine/threonine protein kinase